MTEALEGGDAEGARILHEAIGKLLATPGRAADERIAASHDGPIASAEVVDLREAR